MKKKLFSSAVSFFLIIGFLCGGCGNERVSDNVIVTPEKAVMLNGDEQVLVRVNQSVISAWDLDHAISSSFSKTSSGYRDNKAVREEMLKSLIISRAIYQKRLEEMSEEEMAALDKEAEAFKEKRLVRQYVINHAPPEPVTRRMMLDYYESHPHAFGGETVKTYEMITSDHRLKPSERETFLNLTNRLVENDNWRQWAAHMKQEGFNISYGTGTSEKGMLNKELLAVLQRLGQGEVSDLVYIKEFPYRFKIVKVDQKPPAPFSDVKENIHNRLTVMALKASVARLSEEILRQAKVVYEDKTVALITE